MHWGDQRHLALCLGYVPALAYGSCRVSDQGTTLRASDLHNARATILNPFNNPLLRTNLYNMWHVIILYQCFFTSFQEIAIGFHHFHGVRFGNDKCFLVECNSMNLLEIQYKVQGITTTCTEWHSKRPVNVYLSSNYSTDNFTHQICTSGWPVDRLTKIYLIRQMFNIYIFCVVWVQTVVLYFKGHLSNITQNVEPIRRKIRIGLIFIFVCDSRCLGIATSYALVRRSPGTSGSFFIAPTAE